MSLDVGDKYRKEFILRLESTRTATFKYKMKEGKKVKEKTSPWSVGALACTSPGLGHMSPAVCAVCHLR